MQLVHAAPRPQVAATGNASRTARLPCSRVVAPPSTLPKLVQNRASLLRRSAAEEAAEQAETAPAPQDTAANDTETTGALVDFDAVVNQFQDALAAGTADKAAAESFAAGVQAELTDLRAALAAAQTAASDAEAQSTKLNDQFLRLNADFDNFRKRTASEKQALADSTKGDMLQALLPIVDNFELAKSQLKLESEGEQKVDAAYQSVYRQMVDIFKGFGLEAVPGEGAPFDPEVHEAIMREPSDDVPDGTVLQEFRRGFKMGDQLLRPAMVKVSFNEAAEGAAPAQATEDVAA